MDEAAQNQMVRLSLIAVAIAVGYAVALELTRLPIHFRLGLFVPFALAAMWLLQAISRT